MTHLGTWFQARAIMGNRLQLLITLECRAPSQINVQVATIARPVPGTMFNKPAFALTHLRITGPEVEGNLPAATSTTAGFTLRSSPILTTMGPLLLLLDTAPAPGEHPVSTTTTVVGRARHQAITILVARARRATTMADPQVTPGVNPTAVLNPLFVATNPLPEIVGAMESARVLATAAATSRSTAVIRV